jgi:hypothetical protein
VYPEIQAEAAEAFERCVKNGMGLEDTKAAATAVHQKLAGIIAAKAQDEAKAKREAEQAAKQAALEAKVAANEVQREIVEAEKAGLTEKAEEARKALLVAQREELEATAKAQAEERARVKADAEAKRKAEAEQRALQTAKDREDRRLARQTQREAKAVDAGSIEPIQAPGLKAMAKQGTAKDVAGMMVELLTGTDEPDSVFEEFMALAKASGELSKFTIHGIDAFFITSRAAQARKAG